MKIAISSFCILLCAFALGCSDGGTDCGAVRCGCVSGSSVTVQAPGGTASVVVTSDVLTCTETSPGGFSICSSAEEPFPRTATIDAPGYASVTVMLSQIDPSSTCCPCEGVERYEAEVTLVATAGDGGT